MGCYNYFVDYKGAIQPLTLTMNKKLWAKAEDKIDKNETYTFWGDIISNVITKKITIEADFGEDEERIVKRTIKERMITGAKANEENGYDVKDIKVAIKEKAKWYEDLKTKKQLTGNNRNDKDDNDLDNMLDEED
jgi:hypothetical protein